MDEGASIGTHLATCSLWCRHRAFRLLVPGLSLSGRHLGTAGDGWDEIVLNRKGPSVDRKQMKSPSLQEGASILGFVENPTMHFQGLNEYVSDNQACKETGQHGQEARQTHRVYVVEVLDSDFGMATGFTDIGVSLRGTLGNRKLDESTEPPYQPNGTWTWQ